MHVIYFLLQYRHVQHTLTHIVHTPYMHRADAVRRIHVVVLHGRVQIKVNKYILQKLREYLIQ